MVKVYKIGGNVVDNPEALAAFLDEFARIPGPKVLIHGGGKEATRLCKRLEIPTTMIDGRRVTDADTLEVVTMVYAGLINKRITAALQARDCDAIGFSGPDAGCVRATKRPAEPVDYGFVGDISTEGVDAVKILSFIDAGLTPVFCAITHDGSGNLLNCNADSVAGAVAMGLARVAPTVLIYCFEKDGVLRDIDDPSSVVPRISHETFDALRADGTVSGGMIPKVENALRALDAGVTSVTIRKSDNILTPSGTVICDD